MRLAKSDRNRMQADARRLGWRWVVLVVSPEAEVAILDPARARRGREVRLDAGAAIDNLLAWLDAPSEPR